MGAEPRDSLGTDTRALLARGVDAGVITPAQRDALLALAPEAPPPAPGERATVVAIAYWLGAALVVFALGWFLADRWKSLGAGGVLGVALGYAALFALAAARLARARFPLAAGVAAALATLTVPLAAWALLRLAGEWPPDPSSDPLLRYEPYMATRRLVVELSNVLAVLLALRVVRPRTLRRAPLAVPLAAAVAAALADVATLAAIGAAGLDALFRIRGWAYGAAGAALFGVAYATDRRQPPDEDFAAWLYAAACLVFEAGLLDAFGAAGWARHALAAIALLQLAAGARLRRRTLLAAGVVNVIWYLGYLAFDAFKGVLSFPFLLAAFGASIVGLAVLAQRRFPSLVRHAEGRGVPPSLPGGALTAWAPAALALALLAVEAPRARARAADYARAQRAERAKAHAERRRVGPAPRPPR